MTVGARVFRTWKTLNATLGIVGLVMWAVTVTAVVPLVEGVLSVHENRLPSRLLLSLAVYSAYGLLDFVTTFFNVAMVTSIAARLDGGGPSLTMGLGRASRRVGLIVVYTLVSATIGLLAYLTRPLIHPIVGTLLGLTDARR